MMETNAVGLYVHIPFCKRKCNYCDFCSVASSYALRQKYTKALIREILSYKKDGRRITADTVFFGGGTPSLLEIELFSEIFRAIKEVFWIDDNAEITIEVNPATATRDTFHRYRTLGINRLSIGMQSIHKNELKRLGRVHTHEDFLNCFNTAREVGFDNINVDIMYGIPEQTEASFNETLEFLCALSPEHISAYGLIIEEGTPFFLEADKLPLPSEDEECNMYNSVHNALTAHGYNHYEISNYASRGYEARHNLKYWHSKEYIGLGLSAHSFFLGRRFFNSSDFNEYFLSDVEKYRCSEREKMGIDEAEYIMLRLRLSEGISFSEYKALFGRDFQIGREEELQKYSSFGLLSLDEDRINLTPRGFYLSNTVISSLI